MKNRNVLLTVAVFLGMISGLTAQNVPSYVPTNGLLGWYPFSGTAIDISGNNNNGIANRVILANDRFGNTNSAYKFTGGDTSYIQTPISGNLASPSFSISCWAKGIQNVPNAALIAARNEIDRITSIGYESSNSGTYAQIATANTTVGCGVNYNLFDDGWHNLTFKFENDTSYLFFDGLIRQKCYHNITPLIISQFKIGLDDLSFGGVPRGFNGLIDDVGFWTRGLTQQEITALYQGTNTAVNCPTFPASLAQGLVGYWPFCGNANDESGNGNNGTVNGATLTADRFGNSGSAYGFDGSGSRIMVNTDSVLAPFGKEKYSISSWVKPTANCTTGVITQIFTGTSGNISNYDIGLNEEAGVLKLRFNHFPLAPLISSTDGIEKQVWSNILVQVNQVTDSIFCFKNGLFWFKGPIGNLAPKEGILSIGALVNGAGPFTGEIDDIAIWNRALSQQEITQLYNQGICQTSITVTDTLLIHTGITSYNPVSYSNTLKVWPNPGNQDITLDAGNLSLMQGWKIRVSNSLGQDVVPATLISQQQQTFNISAWGGNGLYLLHLINPQGHIVEVKKIVLAP